ncbi:MAG: nicotinamide riboside transporter PnuC, partial [Bacteroidales bacterium]
VCYLELLAIVAGITCVWLASKEKPINFVFGFISFFSLFCIFYQLNLYSSAILQACFMCFSFYGLYSWTRPKKGEENAKQQQKIRTFSVRQRILGVAIIVSVAFAWGTIMAYYTQYLPSWFSSGYASPLRAYVDAFILVGALTAQYLMARKNIECWMVYLCTDTTGMILYASSGVYFTALLSCIYVGLGANGLRRWLKGRKLENTYL